MSSAYYRLKKHRQLKRSVEVLPDVPSSDSSDVKRSRLEIINSSMQIDPLFADISDHSLNHDDGDSYRDSDNDGQLYVTDSSSASTYRSPDCSSPDSEPPQSSASQQSSSSSNESTHVRSGNQDGKSAEFTFRKKLQGWAVKFRKNLTVEAIEVLLGLLREEKLPNLPKSAAALLRTKSNKNIELMKSSKDTNGSYVYFGIEEGLKGTITDEYTDTIIRLLFNIDGLPLYNGSSEQFWPNLALLVHEEYESTPFIVAVYSGDSKPKDIDEYLKDFIEEIGTLIENGITIGEKTFGVEVIGFSCDTPARSFIKKCKGHGGFYACERCETRGKTKNNRRVYPSLNSIHRTKMSFQTQKQKEHHVGGRSSLLDIPDFDPVNSVFLDSMHLLYLGVMKWILQQILGTKKRVNRKCKLSRTNIKRFNSILKVSVKFMPKEFQRKTLDLDGFSHWKATQFRFFLHYCGALVLAKIFPKRMHRHFLLLVVASRILCDSELCVENVNYARELLRKFFELLPSFYGSDSQVMNSHNLIHLADDVESTQTHLSTISAFPFENHLGKIKRLIRGRNKSLAQLVRRVSEQKSCPDTALKNAVRRKKNLIINPDISQKDEFDLESVVLRGVELSTSKPNNIVKLYSGEILEIKRIRKERQSIFLHGSIFKSVTDAFKFPCASSKVGIFKLGVLSRREKVVCVENITKKCVLLGVGSKMFAVTFLHDS